MASHRSLQSRLLSSVTTEKAPDDQEAADNVPETAVLDLDEAALLHRDPPAERSRLRTRGFANGVVRWWFDGAEQHLCAQITLMRFGDATQASLAESDSWSELLAGGAAFREVAASSLPSGRVRVASIADPQTGRWHALTFVADDDVVLGVAVIDAVVERAVDRVAVLTATQFERLRSH